MGGVINLFKDEELKSAAADAMLKVKEDMPDEFAKQFSGVDKPSQMLVALARHDKAKEILVCMSQRFRIRSRLNIVKSQLPEKDRYYSSGAGLELVSAIDAMVSSGSNTLLKEMTPERTEHKNYSVQNEYKKVER